MSDLHRAVEGEIDAFRPDETPPFAALLDRHRSQHRRRKVLAVAAPAIVAVLVAPVAWTAATSGGDQLVQQAGPSPYPDAPESEPTYYTITYSDAETYDEHIEAVGACVVLPGTSGVYTTFSLPPVTTGVTVTGAEENRDFRACFRPLSGVTLVAETTGEAVGQPTRYAITFQDASTFSRHERAIQACMGLPGASRITADGFVAPDATVAVTGADENAAFRDCMSSLDGVILQERSLATAPPPPWPETAPPPGRKYTPAPFAVGTISPDRRSITVHVAGVAAGCTGQAYGRAVETPAGVEAQTVIDVPLDDSAGCRANLPVLAVTIPLPRPLAADETVLGQCEPNEATPEGRQCSAVSSFSPPTG